MSWRVVNTLLLILKICSAQEKNIVMSSLTFVIDDTGSMAPEINMVKQCVNDIFDTVEGSEESPVENFVLVTFNDPTAKLLTITKDRVEFKRKLADIDVNGGDDCPEYPMTGIKLAIENSLIGSSLYVFTDASAKDLHMYREIRTMAQKKQIQVTFLLTGVCGSKSDDDYQVYYKLAKDTFGEVFNMNKGDISSILEYVKENTKSRSDMLAYGSFPPGYGHKLNYTVDGKMKDIIISVSGVDPKVEVTDPKGKDAETHHITDTKEIKIVKVKKPEPGTYGATIGSKSDTHVKVTGKTTISFNFGFSSFPPTSLFDTASRPPPAGQSYLAIQLHGEGVELKSVVLLSMTGSILEELPLNTADNVRQYYVTELFEPPMNTFRIKIIGYDTNAKTPIYREAATPIERRKPEEMEKVTNTAPTVTIEGAPVINPDYNTNLQLKCHGHGYPTPTLIWQTETGETLTAEILPIEEPTDYLSILTIEKPNKNATYHCKGTNSIGTATNSIKVEIDKYFNVIEAPPDTVEVDYDKEGSVSCKVDAKPPATIIWFKDGIALSSDENITISSDNTTVSVKRMNFETQGEYYCEAKNDFDSKEFYIDFILTGTSEPKINKALERVQVSMGDDFELPCQILEGVPAPTISWSFESDDASEHEDLKETSDILHLKNVNSSNAGIYLCIARNDFGTDLYAVDLIVIYKPSIKKEDTLIQVKDGTVATLPCDVSGVPTPTVKWFTNETEINSTRAIRITKDNSLTFVATLSSTGNYTCTAENKLGSDKKDVYLDVFPPLSIKIPEVTTYETLIHDALTLPCDTEGPPSPKIQWIHTNFRGELQANRFSHGKKLNSVEFKNIQIRDSGYYTCVASNTYESANLTYEVIVNVRPSVIRYYADRNFYGIKGDLALVIQCKSRGIPKPVIIWEHNDLNVAVGTEWYDIENGALIIKNLDKMSEGKYSCIAQNKLGNSTMDYHVYVNDYPEPDMIDDKKYIPRGNTLELKCYDEGKDTDLLRWYKDRRQIASATNIFTIKKITFKDSGIYTCRVSTLENSYSKHTKVTVI